MEERLLIGVAAMLLAFMCACAIASLAFSAMRRRRVALAAQGDEAGLSGFVGWRLRNGVSVLMPLANRLLKVRRLDEFATELADSCAEKGWRAEKASVLSVMLAVLVMLFLLVGLLTMSVVAAFALTICTAVVFVVLANGAHDKKRESVREEVPNALESMAACFGSGFTLMQTFQQVAQEIPGRLGALFGKGAHVLETGGSAEEALQVLREGTDASELAFVAVALDVQHESGGALRQVLDAASDSVKSELALRRSLRVQTAQAKLSARVVVVMPFILIAAFSLASPDFLAPFFSSIAGYALLGLAALMQAAGIVLVRRALSVDGVS